MQEAKHQHLNTFPELNGAETKKTNLLFCCSAGFSSEKICRRSTLWIFFLALSAQRSWFSAVCPSKALQDLGNGVTPSFGISGTGPMIGGHNMNRISTLKSAACGVKPARKSWCQAALGPVGLHELYEG